jgi:two-component system, chemotaxis family, chemotaxis protein CheY
MSDIPTEPILAKRVADSLAMMFEGTVTHAAGYKASIPTSTDGHIVCVPLIGVPNYVVSLRGNSRGCVALASAMFNCAKHLTNQSMIDDAMCELANMVAGQIKNLMARDHQIGTPSVLADDATLQGSVALVGARMHVGDTESEIDVIIAEFKPQVLPEPVAEPVMQGPAIVIAEDDEVTLGYLKAVIQSAGMRVVSEAKDGKQALDDIRRLRPDAVCLDINMPQLSGLQVLATVRKEIPDAIVFLVSSFATAENVREAILLRATGIIVKPFVKARIISELERALAQRAKRRAAA